MGEWHEAKHSSRCCMSCDTPIDVSFFSQHSDFLTCKVSQGFASPPHDPPISKSQFITQTPSQLMYHSGVQTIASRTLPLSPLSASACLSALKMAPSLISESYTWVNSAAVAVLLDDLSSTLRKPRDLTVTHFRHAKMMRVANFMVGVSLKTRVTERRSDVLCKHRKQMMRKYTRKEWKTHKMSAEGPLRHRRMDAVALRVHSSRTVSRYCWPSQSLLHPSLARRRLCRVRNI